MGYNATTLQQVMVYCATPNADDRGVWMDGDGLATDSTGDLYFITGDGSFDVNTGGNDYGDSFVKLSTTGTVAGLLHTFGSGHVGCRRSRPGSGGVLLLPTQSGPYPDEMVSAGKDGTVYLVNRDNMGHYNATTDADIQSLTDIFPNTIGDEGGNFSSPVYFNGSVYFSPVAGPVQAFQLTNGLLSTAPTSESSETYNSRGGTMSISANGSSNGILWTLQSSVTDPNGLPTTPGTLHAYAATNLANELYNSNQAGSRDTLDTWFKFSVPVVANGEVFVASDSRADDLRAAAQSDGRVIGPPGGSSDVVASAAVQTQANTLTPAGPRSRICSGWRPRPSTSPRTPAIRRRPAAGPRRALVSGWYPAGCRRSLAALSPQLRPNRW